MESQMQTREIFLRYTDCAGKDSWIWSHFVWDADLFINTVKDSMQKLNEKQKEGEPRLASVEQITQDEYKKLRKPRA